MQGEVYVQYTPIGGRNLNVMSDGEITGSGGIIVNDEPILFSVSWTYPGGINRTGTWGYLLNREELYTDDKVGQLLETQGYQDEASITNYLNKVVFDYAYRVLQNDTNLPDDENWGAFRSYFANCITFYGNSNI